LQGPYRYLPSLIALPGNTGDVCAIAKAAAAAGVGLIPFGGGSGSVGGTTPDGSQVMVDFRRLRDFSLNEVNCTATGGAGLIGAEFEDMLNERGYTAGHYPQSYQSATLGGMTATRAVGTFSTKYGKMDDMVNALEVVLANGDILKTHSAPKRSTGPELKEIFLGSEGAYGMVTSVEMKVYPISEARDFEAYTFPTTLQGLEAIRQFIQSGIKPAVVRLYDHVESASRVEKYGFEKGWSVLIMGYEGLRDLVDVEKKHVGKACAANGGVPKGPSAGDDWMSRRFSTKKIQDHHAIRGGTSDAIEVAAPWDCIGRVWQEMRRVLEPLSDEVECHFSHVYHTGASVYCIFHSRTGGDDFVGEERYRKCATLAIETSLKNGGNISHHHGVGRLKADYMVLEHGQSGVAVMKEIKKSLDPERILNRGVLGL
jgi:alkyldihydroxyacetonephosphate synthase